MKVVLAREGIRGEVPEQVINLISNIVLILAVLTPLVYSVHFYDFDSLRLPYFLFVMVAVIGLIFVRWFFGGRVLVVDSFLHRVIIVFLGINLISFLVAVNLEQAVTYFSILLCSYILYLYVASGYSPKKFCIEYLPLIMVGIATLVAIIGVPQRWEIYILPWLKITEYKGTFSTLGNINYCGCFMAMTIPLTFLLSLRHNGSLRWALFGSGVLQVIFLALTKSRAGFVAVVVVYLFVLFVFLLKKDPHTGRRFVNPLLMVVGILVLVLVIAAPYYLGGGIKALKKRVLSFQDPKHTSNAMRLGTWAGSLKLWRANPVIGVGVGNFDERYPPYRSMYEFRAQHAGKPVNLFVWVENTHNTYLQVLTETGLVGIIVYLFMLAVFWLRALSIVKASKDRGVVLLVVGLCGGVLGSMVSGFFNSLNLFTSHLSYFFILFGIMEAVAPERGVLQVQIRSAHVILLAVVCIFVLYSASLQLNNAVAELYLRRSESARPPMRAPSSPDVREKARRALEFMEKAVKINPYNWNLRFQLASFYLIASQRWGLKKYDESMKEYEATLRVRPDHIPSLVKLGEVHLHKKDFEKAEELFIKARDLAPDYWYPYFYMGRLYGEKWELKKGSKEAKDMLNKAVNYIKEAVRIKKDFFDAYYYIAGLFDKGGKKGEAIKWVQKMIKVRGEMLKKLAPKKEKRRRAVKWEMARAYIYLGKLYETKRNIKEAIRCGEEAIKIRKDFFEGYYYLAGVYNRQRKVDKAVECMKRMIAVREGVLAKIPLGNKGQREAIMREIGRGYLFAGLYLAKAGRHGEAVKEFRMAKRYGIDVGSELINRKMGHLRRNPLYREFFPKR